MDIGLFKSYFSLTLRRPLREKLWMRWFFDVSEVKDSSFFKSDLTDPSQFFDAFPLEKFCFDQEMRKKNVNFKVNYGLHKVEKVWQNFPHS